MFMPGSKFLSLCFLLRCHKWEKGDPESFTVIIPNSTEKQKQPLRTVSGEDKFRSVFIILPVHVGIISTNDFPSNIRYQSSKKVNFDIAFLVTQYL